jgi:DNA polymerase
LTALNIDLTIALLRSGSLTAALKSGAHVPLTPGHINTLVRATLTASPEHLLSVWDFSQVEARNLAWAATDHDALARFALYDGGDKVNGDPYRAMAARIYGGGPGDYSKESTERAVGKAAELAAGYGQGGGKACARSAKYPHGYNGFLGYVLKSGGNWDEITASMGGGLDKEEASAAIIKTWRDLHAPIVAFWREVQAAAVQVTEQGGSASAGPYAWHNVDGLVLCELPSGRSLVYRGMRCDWEENQFGGMSASLSYKGRKGRERTYGGKLVENLTQATCRDLLAEALIKAEEYGLNPSHTIHDETLDDVPESDAEAAHALMGEIMTTCPAWCRGMPMAAEGLPLARRYGK